jgi:hypothetical protein
VAGIGRFWQLSSRDWIDLGFDIEATGFALGEIEVILDEAAEGAPNDPLDAPRKMKFLSYATQRSQRRWRAGASPAGLRRCSRQRGVRGASRR